MTTIVPPGDPWFLPWPDDEEDEEAEPPPDDLGPMTVYVTDNPVTAELLGPDGEVLRQWLAREPIGYRIRPTINHKELHP